MLPGEAFIPALLKAFLIQPEIIVFDAGPTLPLVVINNDKHDFFEDLRLLADVSISFLIQKLVSKD